MLKKVLQLVILLVILWGVVFWIYKWELSIFDTQVQDQLLDVADRIDEAIEDLENDEDVIELVETINEVKE